MRELDPRRPLHLAENPLASIDEARNASSDATKDRLNVLPTTDQIVELDAMNQLIYERTKSLAKDPLLTPEHKTAVGGLIRAIDQRANWLSSDQLSA